MSSKVLFCIDFLCFVRRAFFDRKSTAHSSRALISLRARCATSSNIGSHHVTPLFAAFSVDNPFFLFKLCCDLLFLFHVGHLIFKLKLAFSFIINEVSPDMLAYGNCLNRAYRAFNASKNVLIFAERANGIGCQIWADHVYCGGWCYKFNRHDFFLDQLFRILSQNWCRFSILAASSVEAFPLPLQTVQVSCDEKCLR
jgi:hypothetical protein